MGDAPEPEKAEPEAPEPEATAELAPEPAAAAEPGAESAASPAPAEPAPPGDPKKEWPLAVAIMVLIALLSWAFISMFTASTGSG